MQLETDIDPRQHNLEHALNTVVRALELFGDEGLAFSFNGGKDSTVLLHLLLQGVQQWCAQSDKLWAPEDGLLGMHVFFFESQNEFPEVTEFVHKCNTDHHLRLVTYACGFREGLARMLQDRPIRGIFLGTRHGDPNCKDQDYFCPSSKGWPPFMRINPVLSWTYGDVWAYLRATGAQYCKLYDLGYTSLGSVKDTVPNTALLRPDGTYAAAYLLSDDRLERSGRELPNVHRQRSIKSALSHTVAIVVIGDELLKGRVADTNSSFLATELHRLGWTVTKIIIVPDTVETIARELQAVSESCEAVITCGGVGPTVDDCTVEAVAMAMGTHVSTNAEFANSLRSYFGDKITDSHLKMAKVPEGCSELIPYSDANGAPSPFPLLAVGNVYVLPGVPSLVRAKWPVVRRQLQQRYGGTAPAFCNRVIKLRIADEARIASCFATLVEEYPDVAAGSYPSTNGADTSKLSISLEGKDTVQVEAAVQRFRQLLDRLPDADLNAEQAIVLIQADVERLTISGRASLEAPRPA